MTIGEADRTGSARRDGARIGWFILAPIGIAAVHLYLLLPMLRSDPPLIAEELRVVFQDEVEVRELRIASKSINIEKCRYSR